MVSVGYNGFKPPGISRLHATRRVRQTARINAGEARRTKLEPETKFNADSPRGDNHG